jgi:membrane carboxypeptidase/penicillin-binding protein
MNPQLTSGVTGAAPIWNQIMSKILTDKPDKIFSPPAGIIMMPCYGKLEYFIRSTEPKTGCPTIKLAPSVSVAPNQTTGR